MTPLAYKKNAEETLARLRSLYAREAHDRIFASFDVPTTALAEFRRSNPEGYCPYPDPHERIAFWDSFLKERAAVEDDSVPGAYLSEFDQALYGGLVGGEAQFMCHDNGWISSMVPPVLGDWSRFDTLAIDTGSLWFRRYADQLSVFVRGSRGKFGVSHFILIDGLNFAFELVGATKTYESLIDCPDMVRRAIEFAFDLNVFVQELFFERTNSWEGGTFSNMAQWLPGRIVSESVDPFHMTSVDYYEKWGRENIERMFARFDGGVLHIHGNGRHLFEAVSALERLKAVFLGDDTGFPKAFDVIADIRRRTGDVPLVVMAPYGDFVARLDRRDLPGGVFYQVMDAPDAASANSCMERVRKYRV
jgi:hypothetical protein